MSDLISRQDAIKALEDVEREIRSLGVRSEFDFVWNDTIQACIHKLEDLPSAEKRGRWIDYELNAKYGWYFANCSECGYQMDVHENRGYFRYCPNCGARMEDDNE